MENLRFLREKANLSIKTVSEQLHVTTQAVGKWERNESFPRAELLPKLSDLYRCTIDALYGRDGQDSA